MVLKILQNILKKFKTPSKLNLIPIFFKCQQTNSKKYVQNNIESIIRKELNSGLMCFQTEKPAL